jgi:uncharacterized membrane protein YphA (DoxX/SURF4 family)
MKIATVIARIFLGLAFLFFGSNFFFHFIPTPPPPPGLVGDYIKVFVASGQANVIGATQVFCGLLLLIGRFVPLALTILGGIIFNILMFHILMDPKGIGPGIVVTLLWLFLVSQYRERFAGILSP